MIIFKVNYIYYICNGFLVANSNLFAGTSVSLNIYNLNIWVLLPVICKAKSYVPRMSKSLETPAPEHRVYVWLVSKRHQQSCCVVTATNVSYPLRKYPVPPFTVMSVILNTYSGIGEGGLVAPAISSAI
jgi:hypothetical protein